MRHGLPYLELSPLITELSNVLCYILSLSLSLLCTSTPSPKITMDHEWELEEGIPQVQDPFIQQYINGRNSLIAQEQKQRHGIPLTTYPFTATSA